MKASDFLKGAAELLVTKGWCQGDYSDGAGRSCALGAMSFATRNARGRTPLWSELCDWLRLGAGTDCIPTWNDTPGRSAEEVIRAMDAAYILALQEEGIEPEDVL